jgi:hypothetical protein
LTDLVQPTMTATTDTAAEKPKRPRPLSLRNARDAKRLLARIVNEVRRGELEPRRASVIVYGVNTFLSVINTLDFEERLAEAERINDVEP